MMQEAKMQLWKMMIEMMCAKMCIYHYLFSCDEVSVVFCLGSASRHAYGSAAASLADVSSTNISPKLLPSPYRFAASISVSRFLQTLAPQYLNLAHVTLK